MKFRLMLPFKLLVVPIEQSISNYRREKWKHVKEYYDVGEEINGVGEADLCQIVKLCEICSLFF